MCLAAGLNWRGGGSASGVSVHIRSGGRDGQSRAVSVADVMVRERKRRSGV
jgi:hypothetical protein